jgi:hypothetical protein
MYLIMPSHIEDDGIVGAHTRDAPDYDEDHISMVFGLPQDLLNYSANKDGNLELIHRRQKEIGSRIQRRLGQRSRGALVIFCHDAE